MMADILVGCMGSHWLVRFRRFGLLIWISGWVWALVMTQMSGEAESIKVAYETLQMTPEEIAEDRELEIASVKASLMATSSSYRKACGQEPDEEDALNFSNQDLKDVNEVILQTAKYAEDPNLRLKAAMYVRDDKKGRKEVVKQMGGQQFNILVFNEQMARIREAKQKALEI